MSVIGLGIDCAILSPWPDSGPKVLGRPVNPGVDPQNAAIDAKSAATGMSPAEGDRPVSAGRRRGPPPLTLAPDTGSDGTGAGTGEVSW
jgi:hypothetical protein